MLGSFKAFGFLLVVATLAGCTSTWVNSVATSADGKHVTVVGAELTNSGFGWEATDPLEWHCVRGEDGKLACKAVRRDLPRD
jgi:hypothetical protein